MNPNPIRVYADTSVYGGVLDAEFRLASEAFFKAVTRRDLTLVTSALVSLELELAPAAIRALYERVLPLAEEIELDSEIDRLVKAYLDAQVLGAASQTDAMHVAAATVGKCNMIVSWNFKHIVNFRRIPLFNGVNLLNEYQPIAIYSPLEVTGDGKS